MTLKNPWLALSVVLLLPTRAFFLVGLWAWFVAPLGVPLIGFLHAIGIILVAQFLIGRGVVRLDDLSDEIREHAEIRVGDWEMPRRVADTVTAYIFSTGIFMIGGLVAMILGRL